MELRPYHRKFLTNKFSEKNPHTPKIPTTIEVELNLPLQNPPYPSNQWRYVAPTPRRSRSHRRSNSIEKQKHVGFAVKKTIKKRVEIRSERENA
ncbi:hypothetical protein Trydic_g8762 [Trypoxylus dichotomus]